MSLSVSKIRRIIERHPLPDKQLNDILQQWMIELAEELADNLLENVEASDKLASKEDIKHVIEMMNIRFEALQKEQMSLRQEMNVRFESIQKEMNVRFEAVQKQIDGMQKQIDGVLKQIDGVHKQIDGVQKQIAFMQWWFSIGGGITLLLIIFKLFFPHIFPR